MTPARSWAARIAEGILDFFAAVTGFYYSKKYAAIVRRLGLRPQTPNAATCPGIIIIQIDGLAYDHLVQAMAGGCLPHVQAMLKKGDPVLAKWRCGLPSTTPAAQAGIMFGNNDDIPAFRWYDKSRRVSVVCKLPTIAARLQSRVSKGRVGILRDGASYVSVFDGDASRPLFTLSALNPRPLFEGVRGLGFIGLFLLNPLRMLRITYLVLKEYIADWVQRLASRIQGRSHLPFLGMFPFLRILSNVVFREVVTFAVLVDIYRGVPAVYATYYGYDEIAHHLGIDSLPARQALRGIDHCIGQIERLSRVHLSRPYTLFLLGDHGLTPSEPFTIRYGQTLGKYIAERLGDHVFLMEQTEGEQQYLHQARFLLNELEAIEKNLPSTAAQVARRIRELVQRRLAQNKNELPQWDVRRQYNAVVKNSGSLAHVYFNIAPHRMDLSEISAAFPGLVVDLVRHEGIWLVVAREGRQCLILAEDGILTLEAEAEPHVEGHNPLHRLPEPWLAAEQVCRIASFPQSGDLILFGSYDPGEDLVVSFENQIAAHGGLGGAQDYPFIMYPRSVNWDLVHVRDSRDLYPLFARLRGLGSGRKDTESETPHGPKA
jgi:hypothetical protein